MEEQISELRDLMKSINSSTSEKMPTKNAKTRIIAVTSGKGGVGKTNLSVNLAIAYAQIGKKVILIDADLGMANVNILLNIVPKYNLMQVINKQRTMEEIVLNTKFGIKFIASANGFSKIANLNLEELDYFAKQFCSLGNADIIIIDTGAGIANNVLQFVAAADEVYIVTTPEPTAITDAYGMIKIITTEIINRELNLKLVVNRVKSADDGKRIFERISKIVGQFLNYKIGYLGFVYDDPIVSTSVTNQMPFIANYPNSKPSVCIKHIINKIENTNLPENSGLQTFLEKFLGKR